MKKLTKTIGPNEKGRDFVIGDLHGAFPCFENLLKNIQFDPAVDRMFSVGDLVDRGPDSMSCLRLLNGPWFHAVLSNHEEMMLEAFRGGYMGNFWLQNGGAWGLSLLNDHRLRIGSDEVLEINDLLERVEELPCVLTLNHANGKTFHIVHAEIPPGINSDEQLADEKFLESKLMRARADGNFLLWGRYRFDALYNEPLVREDVLELLGTRWDMFREPSTLSQVISGHTIMRQPVSLFGHMNIDTAAFLSCSSNAAKYPWAGLTCVCIDTWEFFRATPTDFTKVEPFIINNDEILGDLSETDSGS